MEAFTFPSMAKVRERDRERRARLARMHEAGEYELDDMDSGLGGAFGRPGFAGGSGMAEELEVLRRPGMGKFY